MDSDFEYNPVQTTPFSFKEKVKSHIWKIVNMTIFKLFPNQIKKPRIYLLRLFGAKLSSTVNINRTAKIDHPWNLEMGHLSSLGHKSWAYCLDKITIGEKCCIGEYSFLITGSHNVNSVGFEMVTSPIVINDGCWVTTGVYILPGVTLGKYSVIGAKSLVVKSIEPLSIVGGNPAKYIKKRVLKE
ncbi:putative colanic acid biosynthesis acetyltransferase [Polaribacter vadi]|uniref:putative colanic acid biosynthesis acetyltransferase n=1 Tax=Polaribacter TaxID=52959 RepID=UPI001C09B770|nr:MULTISPECIES: putative colanic acid biosynthesis acetyltransferase [Polaribacter]MBU3010327.1 putative colanic acid biosynthesis acetyltransferase [Polaribacter vadi]MDO6740134.1 putative colanic acid biosynthesis acetyltransferase [Polaribacter sp. 1_MG-2023]